jgi:hypothetical protein
MESGAVLPVSLLFPGCCLSLWVIAAPQGARSLAGVLELRVQRHMFYQHRCPVQAAQDCAAGGLGRLPGLTARHTGTLVVVEVLVLGAVVAAWGRERPGSVSSHLATPPPAGFTCPQSCPLAIHFLPPASLQPLKLLVGLQGLHPVWLAFLVLALSFHGPNCPFDMEISVSLFVSLPPLPQILVLSYLPVLCQCSPH